MRQASVVLTANHVRTSTGKAVAVMKDKFRNLQQRTNMVDHGHSGLAVQGSGLRGGPVNKNISLLAFTNKMAV